MEFRGVSMVRRSPDVLVILFDCLRATDFPGGRDPVSDMPFATHLMNQSYIFPFAISPAPWTIPSHASLFTGLYPWETHVHALRSLNLGEGIPTLADRLGLLGYRSLCLSANPFVSPRFGLVRGFDDAAWAGWWESFVRVDRENAPNVLRSRLTGEGASGDRTLEWLRDGPFGGLLRSAAQWSFRYPSGLDAGNRLVQKVRDPSRRQGVSHAPWIERELSRWLAKQPPGTPTLVFLNLTDTHEPYYPDPELVHGFREWTRLTRVRQDYSNAVGGDWKPTNAQTQRLRELYRQMVHHLDVRLRGIVDAYETSGRWDNTLTVITSDHGQALGEHGMMFHLLRLDDPLVRIPLWLRPPSGDGGGSRAVGWASLVDAVPTALEYAGASPPESLSGRSLLQLVDRERPEPVYAVSDGIVWDHIRVRFRSKSREHEWDRPMVAAYRGRDKAVLTADQAEVHAYDIEQDPLELRDLWPSTERAVEDLVRSAQETADAFLRDGGRVAYSAAEARLRSWGYI